MTSCFTISSALLGAWVVVLALGSGSSCPDGPPEPVHEAQEAPADTISEADAQALAAFRDARALALDPRGRLYVADAGTNEIVVMDSSGARLQTFGGTGAGPGRFDEPVDIDPTNSLQLFVADASNGRIQRFSAEGRFLESVPVQRAVDTQSAIGSVFEQGEEALDRGAPGRPIAVASTATQDLFALDARHRTLLHWDASRRVERLAGDAALGAPVFRDPVGLALDAQRRLYVADAGANAVWVFDVLGTFRRRMDVPPAASRIRTLAAYEQRLWIVGSRSLLVLSPKTGRVLQSYAVRLDAPLVDVARAGSRLYLLTATRLLRVAV